MQYSVFVAHQWAGSHLQYTGIPWGTLCAAKVIRINRGWPHLMRINAWSDVSTCPSLITHAYQSVIDCFELAQVSGRVLCNLCEHLLYVGFVKKIRTKKFKGEKLLSSFFFFTKGTDLECEYGQTKQISCPDFSQKLKKICNELYIFKVI